MATVPTTPPGESQPVWEIATLYPPQGVWREAEYLRLTDDTNRLIEFTDGNLEFLAMPTRIHQRILKYLLFALSAFVEDRNLGEVLPAGIRIKVGSEKYRMPDIVYLAKQSENAWGGDRFFEGADLAIEIVSEDDQSHRRDYEGKLADYAEARIPEYWNVDPQQSQITILTLPEGASEYQEHGVFSPSQQATSKLLDGFTVDVQSVFDAAKG